MKARKILVLNGPNLDMLGVREPDVYGTNTLGNLEYEVQRYGEGLGVEVSCYQSNSEAKLIGKIHKAADKFDGIVYNPGAHTHYSYALRDAVASVDVPVVEVHLSDIEGREPFRRISVIAPACIAQVKGMGIDGYRCAIDILRESDEHEKLGEGFKMPPGENIVIGGAAGSAGAAASTAKPDADAATSLEGDFQAVFVEAGAANAETGESGADSSGATDGDPDLDVPGSPEGAAGPAELSRGRQNAVREVCSQLGIGALLVRDTSNIQWLTAIDGVFDEERAHALLIAGSGSLLHTDSRYANALQSAVERIGSDVVVNSERMGHAQFAHASLTASGAKPVPCLVGFEDSSTYAEYVRLVEGFTVDNLAPTTDLVLGLRAVKDSGEIERLRAAQAVTDAAFDFIVDFIRPGMTEREVQLALEDFMLRNGADELAFSSIVATGANGADPHAIPGDTVLEAGQCVVLDFGAKVAGYCSDMTRTVFLGMPDEAMRSAWDVLRQANESVEAYLKPGVTGVEAHQLAEQVLEEGGFGGRMGHGLGHGVGIDVHELPTLGPRSGSTLVAGNVVTVEPGIYLPGEFGMRLEDFGVVTETGFDVFTQSTHEMVVL